MLDSCLEDRDGVQTARSNFLLSVVIPHFLWSAVHLFLATVLNLASVPRHRQSGVGRYEGRCSNSLKFVKKLITKFKQFKSLGINFTVTQQ